MLVLEKPVLTIRLEMYLFVRTLDMFMFVMVHAEKLLWIRPMSFGSVQYLGSVLTGYCHQLKWSQMLNSNKVVLQMRQNHLWDPGTLSTHHGLAANRRRVGSRENQTCLLPELHEEEVRWLQRDSEEVVVLDKVAVLEFSRENKRAQIQNCSGRRMLKQADGNDELQGREADGVADSAAGRRASDLS